MKYLIATILALMCLCLSVQAQSAPDAAELTKLVNEFLVGASHNDAAVHDRFWAEDLIYTRSSGIRVGKAEIMNRARSAPPPKPGDPVTTYTAEDLRVQQYGQTALVAFRLVGKTVNAGVTQVSNFLNTGTFVKRSGKWQVVGWQSTKMATPVEQSKTEVAAVESAFQQAMLGSDVKTLGAVLDDTFVWTTSNSETLTKQPLIEDLRSGSLKFSKLETKNVVISIYGDTAIVRGDALSRRSSTPAKPGIGDTAASTAYYTITFVNFGGTWKAVGMHSSLPGG